MSRAVGADRRSILQALGAWSLGSLIAAALPRGVQAGVDRTLIALWLGHESVETTQIYLDADLAIKERALSKTTPINAKPGRFQPDDDLLAFLKGL